jgi:hypothetical protein
LYNSMLPENNGFVKPALRRQLDKIKSAVSIAEVAGEYGTFKQTAPARLLGRCLSPSHEDKTPSMQLFTDTQTFKCFGCHVRGDVLDLIRLLESCDLVGAMGLLAGRYGISLESTRPRSWFARQARQAPIRERIEAERIDHIRALVFRLVFAPWLTRLPVETREESADSAWRESRTIAAMLYRQRGGA